MADKCHQSNLSTPQALTAAPAFEYLRARTPAWPLRGSGRTGPDAINTFHQWPGGMRLPCGYADSMNSGGLS